MNFCLIRPPRLRIVPLSGLGTKSDIKQKPEEALPLGESVSPEAAESLVRR